jgi:hypothetical protein
MTVGSLLVLGTHWWWRVRHGGGWEAKDKTNTRRQQTWAEGSEIPRNVKNRYKAESRLVWTLPSYIQEKTVLCKYRQVDIK